jgi:hypothetical protein
MKMKENIEERGDRKEKPVSEAEAAEKLFTSCHNYFIMYCFTAPDADGVCRLGRKNCSSMASRVSLDMSAGSSRQRALDGTLTEVVAAVEAVVVK